VPQTGEIVVAVAFDMGNSEEGDHGEISLERHDREIGQVFGAEEVIPSQSFVASLHAAKVKK
jgi:hypothetical protein